MCVDGGDSSRIFKYFSRVNSSGNGFISNSTTTTFYAAVTNDSSKMEKTKKTANGWMFIKMHISVHFIGYYSDVSLNVA